MKLDKLAKTLLALTAASLTLQFGTGCDEKTAPGETAPTAAATAPAAAKPTAAPSETAVSSTFVQTPDGKSARLIEMAVTDNGYEPSKITVVRGQPVVFRITRKTDNTCATEILITDSDVNVKLPLNQTVDVPYTPTKTGEIKFGCAMDKMISGVLLVEEA